MTGSKNSKNDITYIFPTIIYKRFNNNCKNNLVYITIKPIHSIKQYFISLDKHFFTSDTQYIKLLRRKPCERKDTVSNTFYKAYKDNWYTYFNFMSTYSFIKYIHVVI